MKISRCTLALALLAPALCLAQSPLAAPNWDERLARQAAQLESSEATVAGLFEMARAAEGDALRENLDALIAGRGYTAPARDYILFRFTVGLADLDSADPSLLAKLSAVQPAVYVSHPERPDFGVPLYNIAGAAAGVARLNQRRQAADQAERNLEGSPEVWVEAYLAASPAQRKGYVDALSTASNRSLERILHAARSQMSQSPELTPIAGKAALLLGESGDLADIVRYGSGDDLARILEAAALTLPAGDRAGILLSAVQEAPGSNAALAIAQLYPGLSDRPDSTELLFETLQHPELGAASAMALARHGSADTRARLRAIAAQSGAVTAGRASAALALDPVAPGAAQ